MYANVCVNEMLCGSTPTESLRTTVRVTTSNTCTRLAAGFVMNA